MPRMNRKPGEKAKDFKGTLKKLIKYAGRYRRKEYDKDNGWFGTLSYAKIYDDLDSYQSHAHRPWQVSLTKQF